MARPRRARPLPPRPTFPLLALRPFLRQPSSRLPPRHHLLAAPGCTTAAGRRVGVGRPPTLALLIHRGLRGAVRQAHRPRQWRAPPPRHRRAAPLAASCASTPSLHNFPLTPPHPPPPQAFPLGGQALSAALDLNTTTKAAGLVAKKAVSVWEQRYPNEPCAAPVSCPCQFPLPAAWAQLSAAYKL